MSQFLIFIIIFNFPEGNTLFFVGVQSSQTSTMTIANKLISCKQIVKCTQNSSNSINTPWDLLSMQ